MCDQVSSELTCLIAPTLCGVTVATGTEALRGVSGRWQNLRKGLAAVLLLFLSVVPSATLLVLCVVLVVVVVELSVGIGGSVVEESGSMFAGSRSRSSD